MLFTAYSVIFFIWRFLETLLSKPSNPYEVVIKNRFFPDGLTEQDIYQYWMKKKFEILKTLEGSRSIFYINGDLDKMIVRRYLKKNEQIKLIPENYDNVVTGRTVGILRVFDERSDFGIVDVDSRRALNEISPAADFEDVKHLAGLAYDYFSKFFKCKLYYTGKNGFHIHVHFNTKVRMNQIKEMLEEKIKDSKLKDFFGGRNDRNPNLDLSPNMKNGCFVIPGSINRIGLPCVEVKRENLNGFKRESLVKHPINEDVEFNGFLDPKYLPALRSMKRRYVASPRPLNASIQGLSGKYKKNMRIGSTVALIGKESNSNDVGMQMHGRIIRILTPRDYHALGIKVILDTGRVGRVQEILVY